MSWRRGPRPDFPERSRKQSWRDRSNSPTERRNFLNGSDGGRSKTGSRFEESRRGAQSLGDLAWNIRHEEDPGPLSWRNRPRREQVDSSRIEGVQNGSRLRGRGRGRGRGGDVMGISARRVEVNGTLSGANSVDDLLHDIPMRDGKPRLKRQYPIGRMQLEELLKQPSDMVILELLREQSGYKILLQQENIRSDNIFLVVAVLSRACSAKSNRESLHELFMITCEQKFLDKLCAFSMTIKRQYPAQASAFFGDLHTFLDAYANAFPTNAIDRISDLLDACIIVITNLQSQELVSEDLVAKYQELQVMLTEAKERWVRQKAAETQFRRRGLEMDHMEPPDDFRELPVIPVAYDLSLNERPFLRRNLVEGKYQDDEHYLDVQFRLLREDFVRPLRNGIHDFKSGERRVRDVRIYRDVTILGSDVRNKRIVYLIQLNLPKKFKIENSKRLLFGNLLCFTNDNFKSMFLASVAERDPAMVKKGVIGVTLETDITGFKLSKKFLMVESRAYFMAYKHVLQALKTMSGKGVPMAPYIVHVDNDVKPPKYMDMNNHYDLRVVREIKMMKTSEVLSKLFHSHAPNDIVAPDDRWPQLSQIPMRRGLDSWPTHLELRLDKSQHKALHGALTNELAIIQGPPGTGKTFIGLKITQILLHNSHIWKKEDNPTPILVVCFTNHALDQFLEGMTSYTQSIVRIGSRSKNEAISRFQVNNLARTLHSSRRRPSSIHERNRILMHEAEVLEKKVKNLRTLASNCVNPEGILSLQWLLREDVVPAHLKHQFQGGNGQMVSWLLLNMPVDDFETLKRGLSQKEGKHFEKGGEKNGDEGNSDEEFLEDFEELLRLEEEDRRLDEEEEQGAYYSPASMYYERTLQMIDEEMNSLTNRERNPDEYFLYTILADQRRGMELGLWLPERHEEMAVLEQQNINIWFLDFPTRWALYKFWLSKVYDKVMGALTNLEQEFQQKAAALQEIRYQEHLHIMRNAAIVGMTTTGAAQYNAVMQDLAPAIVIIEEAAEILESHVIASLTCNCQHLILIGDHQQLRPSATVYELATKYGLETSVFERMINNGLTYECLEYQHRMRPSISKLLVPSIYPTLKDHESVGMYPCVKGVTKDLFFISHHIYEKKDSDDNNSHENIHEAEFTIALLRHLMLQGYSPDDITVLTPYSGQFFLLKKLQREHPVCSGARICVVDNFQGEENKIILLSLVRSNVEGKVGFLRTDNRVCVALSRAKQGLYITGNMDLLCASSKLWQDIRKDLEAEGNLDSALTLRCENHPDEVHRVSTGGDFFKKSPEGGCLRLCNKALPRCDHLCPKVCHMDDLNHDFYKCHVPCPKILCSLGHPCPKQCWQKCGPCQKGVSKTLPCGHMHTIPCHIAPEDYDCPTKVRKILPDCQHEDSMPCHENPESWKCPIDCDTRLDCGHMCRQKCHVKEDPDHKSYDCQQNCTRLNADCTQNHLCQKKCYEKCGSCVMEIEKVLPCGHKAINIQCHVPPEKVQCQEKCKRTLSCGHACKKTCYQPCGNCPVKVKKIVPSCQHQILIECGVEPTTDECDGDCPKILSCGHPCVEKCNQPCTKSCKAMIPSLRKCPKNHSITISCYQQNTAIEEDFWMSCVKACGQKLECGHICEGKCGECLQGRLHMSCQKPCKKSLVCGHICKHPCSASCPPCQEKCEWKCSHSQCKESCGILCTPCKEPCKRRCKHVKCNELCGTKCTEEPCEKPCEKKLKCGHTCVGFCGDPCPPVCRVCNGDKLTDFTLLGFEEDDDARFVLLEDCGHSIEARGLEAWLQMDEAEIGMKTCPRCRKPIYNNLRYKNIILESYKMVKDVKQKYLLTSMNGPKENKKGEIEKLLSGVTDVCWTSLVKKLQQKVGVGSSKKEQKKKFFNGSELQLYHFQASVLGKLNEITSNCKTQGDAERLKPVLRLLVKRVMQRTHSMPPQMAEEIGCELQRLRVLTVYWELLEKRGSCGSATLSGIVAKLEKIMDPTIKFDSVTEGRVVTLLKESEAHVGSLRIPSSERIRTVKSVGLKQGQWYKCPRGHAYCRYEGVTKCPDCGVSVVEEDSDSSDSSETEST